MSKLKTYEFHLSQAVECGRIAWDAYAQGNASKTSAYARNYREHVAKCVKHLERTMYPMVAGMVLRGDLVRAHKETP